MTLNCLQHLKTMTTIVADTGDIQEIKTYCPRDATTNPSLILKVVQQPRYQYFLDQAVQQSDQNMNRLLQRLLVGIGTEILSMIPGRVSIEVDARLSLDTHNTILFARQLVQLFEQKGVDRSRLLIKIVATWEGIQAAKRLEDEGIHCNLTLLFSFAQAVMCAQAEVTLISPFVGRILDWYKVNQNFSSLNPADDPGVIFVDKVYNYLKKFAYRTEIMGASFRNTDQIMQLAGCDLLTISPVLLGELTTKKIAKTDLDPKLSCELAQSKDFEKVHYDEKMFRRKHVENIMATEKLNEGINNFIADNQNLEQLLKSLIRKDRH